MHTWKKPAWNSLCLDELRNYGQVECSGWAYGILILAARAATRFPRQLLEFRAISRKSENDGNLDKTFFKRTAVVQEFLLIKSYERLFGAICAIHVFLQTACILNPSCFQKVPSLVLSRWLRPPFGSIPICSTLIFRRPLVPKTGMPRRVDGRTKASLDSKRGSRNGKGPREIQDKPQYAWKLPMVSKRNHNFSARYLYVSSFQVLKQFCFAI